MKKLFTLIIFLFFFRPHIVYAGYSGLEKAINSNRSFPLVNSSKLDVVAYCRAKYMVDRNIFTHDGETYCFKKYGLTWNYGEILAQGYNPDGSVVSAWMGSPSHRSVIVNKVFRKIGSSKVGDIIVVVFSK